MHAKKKIKKYRVWCCNAYQNDIKTGKRMPILIFLQMAPGVDMKSCNACQNRYLVSKRMPKNVEIKIWSGNAFAK